MARPVLVYTVYDRSDGSIDIIDAPDEILVADRFLAEVRPPYADYGDGILTIHARNGDVSYGLHHHDPFRCQWQGTRC
jgi:hypothetical protein